MRTAGKSVVFSLLLSMIVLAGGYAQAAGVGITSAGGGVFYLQGYSMDGVAGMNITVTYDANSISNPTVVPGPLISNQGALLSSNTAIKGIIRIGAITSTSFTGNGLIATLTFTRHSSVALKIPIPTVTGIDPATNPVEIATITGTEESTDTTTGGQGGSPSTDQSADKDTSATDTASTGTPPTGTSPSTWLGSVSISTGTPLEAEKKDEVKKTEVAAADALKEPATAGAEDAGREQEQPAGKEEAKAAKEPKFLAYKGVLETLKAYTGPRQPQEILDLFGQQSKGYRQEPPVFLADGKGVLKVRITPPHDVASAPNVAINKEAQLVSFRRGDENTWVVELRPKVGAFQVVLTYFLDDTITEIPLTVAPLLATYNGKPFATLTEADFREFLARGGDPAAQKGNDLSGDGVTDYLDDYLFAANYLVQTAAAKPAAKEQKASPPPVPAAGQKVLPPKKTR